MSDDLPDCPNCGYGRVYVVDDDRLSVVDPDYYCPRCDWYWQKGGEGVSGYEAIKKEYACRRVSYLAASLVVKEMKDE